MIDSGLIEDDDDEFATRLDELPVEFGVPLCGAEIAADPFVFSAALVIIFDACPVAAFNEFADKVKRLAAAEFDGWIPATVNPGRPG